MPATRPADLLRHLGHADLAHVGDGDLLARFAAARDPAAFAALVRRHGPLVLTVCRRVTGHPQDAEDAFQAVFLVLARKAAAVRAPDRLGNWLYGVAVRVARKARRSAARRRAREVPAVDVPDPAAPAADPPADIGPVLHEELAALPAYYRDAIVLCDLRGNSRADAAKALGIPEGTLSSRLATGRKRLADRLTRRGVTLPAAAVSLVLAEGRAAAIPEPLVTKTCGLVADWSAGGVVPAAVLRLAQGGFAVRKTLLLGFLATTLTAAGVGLAARPGDDPKPADPPKPAAVAEKKPIVVATAKPDDAAIGFTSSPRLRKAIDLPIHRVSQVIWDQKGTAIAALGLMATGEQKPVELNTGVIIPDVLNENLQFIGIQLGESGRLVSFAPDGKHLITAIREYNLISGFHRLQFREEKNPQPGATSLLRVGRAVMALTHSVDLEAGQTRGYAFAPDHKSFRTIRSTGPGGPHEVLDVSAETGKTLQTLMTTGEKTGLPTLAGNGKRLAVIGGESDFVEVWNVDRGALERTVGEKSKAGAPSPFFIGAIRFSADSRLLLLTGLQGGLRIYDVEAGAWAAMPEGRAPGRYDLHTQSFSPDNKLLVMSGLMRGNSATAETWVVKVWEVATGKLLKSWNQRASVAWCPSRPILAVLEPNGEGKTRLGLWDFSAEVPEKK